MKRAPHIQKRVNGRTFGRPSPGIICGLLALFTINVNAVPSAVMDGTSADMWGTGAIETNAARGMWLKDSRFAMFIHWGLFSQLADQWQGKTYYGISEWLMNRAKIPAAEYANTAAQFHPTNFNAREWVELAQAAGMNRIVITAKHHEGFAMFDSAASPFNIVAATSFKRDPIKELSQACQAEHVRLGFYYSQSQDWHEPDAVGNTWDWPPSGRNFQHYLDTKAVPQIKELLTGCGPVATMWFDTPGPITPADSKMLVDLVHQYQPRCLVNSRIGNGQGDYDTLGDMEIPALPRPGLWESIDTLNDTWGYAGYDHNWKSPREIAERLVRVASRGGSYMLNIGPDGTGRIPEQAARVLREAGQWVHAHEAAINGSDPTPFGSLSWGEATTKSNRLFLFVFQWPDDGRLVVPGLTTKVVGASLDDGSHLPVQSLPDAVVVTLPGSRPSSLIPMVTLELAGPAVANRDQYVLNDCLQTLDAASAQLQGCELSTARWMEKFGDWKTAECVAGWQGPASSATWNFQTLAPGIFYLDLEYTCPAEADYAAWAVALDGQRLDFPLIDTGERDKRAAFGGALPRFRTCRVGMIEITHRGSHSLTLNPAVVGGKSIRISVLHLKPVNMAGQSEH